MCLPAFIAVMPEPVLPFDENTVLTTARDLHDAARVRAVAPLLAGKHLCVLGEAVDGRDCKAFIEAARELGAQVTALHPGQLALRTPADVTRCAGVLGRLYDAVECQGVAPGLVHDLGEAAAIPVYDGLACEAHATAALAARLDVDAPEAIRRRRVLQAMLVGSLA